jgi:hypothetical protein
MNATSTIVRRWVGVYTGGLPKEVRDARRAEIECDLWSHAEDAYERGRGPWALELEMAVRLVLGMPADVAWRRSHRGSTALESAKELAVHEPRSHHVLTAIGIAIAVLVGGLFGLFALRTNMEWFSSFDAVFAAGSVIAVIGLLLVHRQPQLGGGLTVLGAAIFGGLWAGSGMGEGPFWGLVVAAAIATIGLVRSQQVLEAQRRRPA